MSIVSFQGVAVENIIIGAAVQIELDVETGHMIVRALRPEDLRATVEREVADALLETATHAELDVIAKRSAS